MSVNKVNSDGSLSRVAGGTLYADAPVGTISPFGGSTVPNGYLLCNGQAVSRTDYAELFAAIGTAFGTGDGSTTFNVPDLRETVPVGTGTRGSGVATHDTYSVGTFKDDQLQTHNHTVSTERFDIAVYTDYLTDGGTSRKITDSTEADSVSNPLIAKDVTDARTGTTTHGKQLGVNYIIKAKQMAVPADITAGVEDMLEEVTAVIPSSASSSNLLTTNDDVADETLTSSTTILAWASAATTTRTAFIGTSDQPSDAVSGWGEHIVTVYGKGTRKIVTAMDYSVATQTIYTRKLYNGAWTTNWTKTVATAYGLTSTISSGSENPITSGAVANVAGYCGQYDFDSGTSIIISLDSTAFRRVTIYQDTQAYSFIVHEWGGTPKYHWILGTELPSGITASYSGYRLTLTNNSFGTARMVIEAPSNPVVA